MVTVSDIMEYLNHEIEKNVSHISATTLRNRIRREQNQDFQGWVQTILGECILETHSKYNTTHAEVCIGWWLAHAFAAQERIHGPKLCWANSDFNLPIEYVKNLFFMNIKELEKLDEP